MPEWLARRVRLSPKQPAVSSFDWGRSSYLAALLSQRTSNLLSSDGSTPLPPRVTVSCNRVRGSPLEQSLCRRFQGGCGVDKREMVNQVEGCHNLPRRGGSTLCICTARCVIRFPFISHTFAGQVRLRFCAVTLRPMPQLARRWRPAAKQGQQGRGVRQLCASNARPGTQQASVASLLASYSV